jgi:hypothetical protein
MLGACCGELFYTHVKSTQVQVRPGSNVKHFIEKFNVLTRPHSIHNCVLHARVIMKYGKQHNSILLGAFFSVKTLGRPKSQF